MKARVPVTIHRLCPQPLVGLGTLALALAALGLSWWRDLSDGRGDGLGWAHVALAAVLYAAVIVTYRYPIHLRHQTKVMMGTVVYYLLAVLIPPPLAALAAGLGSVSAEVSRRVQSGAYPSDIAGEAGRRTLIVLLAALASHDRQGTVPSAAALLAAAAILLVLDAVSLPLVLAPICGERPSRVMIVTARDASLAEGIQYAVGLLGALAAIHYPWALALLVVPIALVYAAFKTLKEMHDGTRLLLENMADAVDLRDAYTGGHSRRVAEYSAAILRELNHNGPEVTLIIAAARVHDIGKIGVPDAILYKPGPLTDEERAVMEDHPVHGANLLKRYPDFARGVEIVLHHHESWDGAGYPHGLKGSDIPFGSRVIAVADSFDAMTSDRPYRSGMSAEKALSILREGRGRQWDAAVVDAFLRTDAAQHEGTAARGASLPPATIQGKRGGPASSVGDSPAA